LWLHWRVSTQPMFHNILANVTPIQQIAGRQKPEIRMGMLSWEEQDN